MQCAVFTVWSVWSVRCVQPALFIETRHHWLHFFMCCTRCVGPCKQFHRQSDNSFMFAMDQLHCMQFKNILSSKQIISGWASYVHCWKYNRDSFRCCRQFLCATDWFVGYWRQFCEFAAQFVILIMASLCPCPQRVMGGRQGQQGNALKPCKAQCHSTKAQFSTKKRSHKVREYRLRQSHASNWLSSSFK